MLLEEIANEVKSVELKNRELYASAIDIDDEERAIKVQTESYSALRRMRGLKSAMETFKSALETSGILKSNNDGNNDDDAVYISNEHGDFAKPSKISEKVVQSSQHNSPQNLIDELLAELPSKEETTSQSGEVPQPEIEYGIPEPNEADEYSSDEALGLSEPIPDYIAEEIDTMGDIIGELNKSIDEINGESDELDDDFADLIQVSLEEDAEVDEISESEIETAEEETHPVFELETEITEFEPELNMGSEMDESRQSVEHQAEQVEQEQEVASMQEVSEQEEEQSEVADIENAPSEDDFSGFVMSMPEVGIYNNRIPKGFVMFGRRVDVRDWSDMLVKVCEILILKSPYTVAQFDKYHDLNPLGNRYFSYNRSDIKGVARKLSNGLWIELNRSNDDVVMLCKKVLELCGYPRSDLEIEFAE